MFFSDFSPRSTNSASILPRTWSWAAPEISTPPGSQIASSRAAILTPSPRMSSPSIRHVAEVDADAIDDTLRLGNVGVALDHQRLDRDRAFDGGDDGGKLQQQPIARRLDDPAPKSRHDRPRRLAMLAHRLRRARLVLAHQSGIADDVDGHDRGESPVFGHCTPKFLASLAEVSQGVAFLVSKSPGGRSSFSAQFSHGPCNRTSLMGSKPLRLIGS